MFEISRSLSPTATNIIAQRESLGYGQKDLPSLKATNNGREGVFVAFSDGIACPANPAIHAGL